MDIKSFTNKLFLLYPNSFNAQNEFIKKRQYIIALDNPKVDFEILLDRIAKYHKSEFMPTPAWLKEESKHSYKKEFRNSEKTWRHLKIYNPIYKEVQNTDCFPPNTTDSQILKTYEKLFPNTQGWEIVTEN